MAHYQTNFNAPDYDLGPLPGQQGWFNPAPGVYLDPTIEEAVIFSGREVHATSSAAQQAVCVRFFDGFGAGGVQWLKGSFASREQLAGMNILIADVGLTFLSGLFTFGVFGNLDKIMVQDGGSLVPTGVTFAPDEPHTVKAKINFATKKWDAYVDGLATPLMTDLDLQYAGINDLRGFAFIVTTSAGTKVMDDFFVGDFDPDSAIFRRRREL